MMGRLVAICQPHYVPWLGYFEMIDRVDAFYLLDDVDFIKREWKNRNRIRKERESPDAKWLTVPIARSCQRGTRMDETRIAAGEDWRERHLAAVRHVYAGARFVDDAAGILRRGLETDAPTLADLNVGLLREACAYLGVTTPMERVSRLDVPGRKTEKLVNVCLAAGADAYLANNASAAYLESGRFADARIRWSYQDYAHPTYAQASRGRALPFLSHLSILDLIANHGPKSLEILRGGRP